VAGVRLFSATASLLDVAFASLVGVNAVSSVRYRGAVGALERGRRAEAESFARILSGLSRSVSEDAILDAIAEELVTATDADHIVVARRRPEAKALQATLISARVGVPPSTTLLPLPELDHHIGRPSRRPVAVPIEGDRLVAVGPGTERIAEHVRGAYGLTHMLAAPLHGRDGVEGAIVLSRRSPEAWSDAARRLLTGAAAEASAALSRAGSHRTAEVQATTDPLTGLPNRRYFDEICDLLARRRRADDAVGILMVDIDKFKALNDRYGHGAGDEVLKLVGDAIVGGVRDDDVPARFGGEEFVVLLRNPTQAVALEIGERVRRSVAALDLSALGIGGVTVSVGAAVATRADQPIADLIETADAALYRAKRAGRDRVVAA
jgi:diguanylate cyclase (GGDEF)-like protein